MLASARSTNGSLNLTSSVPAAGTYNLVLTDNSGDLAIPSYSMDTTLPKQHAAAVSLALKDASGNTLASATGPSPLSITQTAVSGVYSLVVNAVSGTVSGLLTGSYPGRLPKEIIAYDANDHAVSIDDGTNTTKETLAPSGRVLHRVVTDDMFGTVSDDTIFGYAGSGDSPAYTRSGLLGLAVTTYVSGPGGLLSIDTGGTASYPISNAHGDIVGTTDASGNFTANPRVDEFGVGTTASAQLGYLGSKERLSTGGNLDLIRMGLRLYDPAVGRFLEIDPVPGGSANSYDYSDQDPVNGEDPQGTINCRVRLLPGGSLVGGGFRLVICTIATSQHLRAQGYRNIYISLSPIGAVRRAETVATAVMICTGGPEGRSCAYDHSPDLFKPWQTSAHTTLKVKVGEAWYAGAIAVTPRWNGYTAHLFGAAGVLTPEDAGT